MFPSQQGLFGKALEKDDLEDGDESIALPSSRMSLPVYGSSRQRIQSSSSTIHRKQESNTMPSASLLRRTMLKEEIPDYKCTKGLVLMITAMVLFLICSFIALYRTTSLEEKQSDNVEDVNRILVNNGRDVKLEETILENVLPVVPFDEYLFENHPVSNYRFYTRKMKDLSTFLTSDTTPIVSVITSYYNTGAVLKETRDSLYYQTFNRFEWIVINDKSQIEHNQLLFEILGLDEDVSFYKNIDGGKVYKKGRITLIMLDMNQGPGGARNIAVKEASRESKYLTFLDSDDLIEPSSLEKMFLFLEFQKFSNERPITLVNSFSMAFSHMNYFHLEKFQESSFNIPFKNIFPITFMIHKEVFDYLGGFNSTFVKGMEDWDFWVNYIYNGYRAWTIPEVLFWYRLHAPDNRWSFTREDKRYDDPINSGKENFLELHLKKHYQKLYSEHVTELNDFGYLKSAQPKVIPKVLGSAMDAITSEFNSKKNSILFVCEHLNDLRRLEVALNLVRQYSQDGFEVTLITTDTIPNHEYKPQFEKYTNNVFHLNNILDKKYKNQPKQLSLLMSYIISTRQIDTIVILESLLGYKALPLLPESMRKVRIMDYIYTTDSFKYIRQSNSVDMYIYKRLISSVNIKEFSKYVDVRNKKNLPLYPSVVFPNEWSAPSKEQIQQLLTASDDYILTGAKDFILEPKSNQIILSYWITGDVQTRCDTKAFDFISQILGNKKLVDIKILLLTDNKMTFDTELHPDSEKRSPKYLALKARKAKEVFGPFFRLAAEYQDRVLVMKPIRKSNTRSLREFIHKFAPLAHVMLFSESCHENAIKPTIPPVIFQSMASSNAVIGFHNNNPSLLEFVKTFNIGMLVEGSESGLLINLLTKWVTTGNTALNQIRHNNLALTKQTLNTNSMVNKMNGA